MTYEELFTRLGSTHSWCVTDTGRIRNCRGQCPATALYGGLLSEALGTLMEQGMSKGRAMLLLEAADRRAGRQRLQKNAPHQKLRNRLLRACGLEPGQ